MQLIGMMDSPYVRRVAISMRLMDIPFIHRSISVFRGFDAFQALNPVVKAPTLICDDGGVLMDSTLILDYLASITTSSYRLLPLDASHRLRALRLIGLALAASEKSVQMVYETRLRPQDKQFSPWLERIGTQLLAAYRLLEHDFTAPLADETPDLAAVSVAVAWRFTRELLPDVVPCADFPVLNAWSQSAEQQPAFIASPFDD